ncbi:hypothetical protein G7Y89_g8474 [Cudoniella acicularis]|uniref:Uncharacterized protein n=1 Tax=Cudoniella acicularis TaxID=354080 RepID=A0A8H4W2U4_9HELO|nr:hypothetical protein G7Y89_g8474 [Cudoniella acicularis]
MSKLSKQRGLDPLPPIDTTSSNLTKKSERLEDAFSAAIGRGQIGSHKRTGSHAAERLQRETIQEDTEEVDTKEVDTKEVDARHPDHSDQPSSLRNSIEYNKRKSNQNADLRKTDSFDSKGRKRSSSLYSRREHEGATDLDFPDVYKEPLEEKLQRNREFFDNRPLMRCLDDYDKYQIIGDLLFDRLLEEVQVKVDEIADSKYRGEIKIREFWGNVRSQLNIDDEEIYHDWPYVEEPVEDLTKGLRKFRLGSKMISRWWKMGIPIGIYVQKLKYC